MKLVDLLAAVWLRRASAIEVAGAGCVVYAASLVGAPLAWLVAGVMLVVKALTIPAPA